MGSPNRTPAGTPAGGQFAATPHAESTRPLPPVPEPLGLDLSGLSDEQHNARGTFSFPPSARSAEQVVAFWRDVQIPDDALDTLAHRYFERSLDRERVVRQRIEAAEESLRLAVRRTTRDNLQAQLEQHRATLAEMSARRYIHTNDLRNVLLAAKIYWDAPRLADQVERDTLRHTRVTLASGETPTVAEIVERYELNDFRRNLDGREGERRARAEQQLRDRREQEINENLISLLEVVDPDSAPRSPGT